MESASGLLWVKPACENFGGNMPVHHHQRSSGTSSSSSSSGRGFLSLTFTSVATMGVSAYLAVTSAAAQPLTQTGDLVILGGSVALATFLGAKLGKVAGGFVGGLGGAGAGAVTGATLGGLASGKAEGAAAGGMVGGAGLGLFLAIAGAMAGYWTGAYFGHQFAKDITVNHLYEKNGIATQSQDTQDLRAPAP
jgi:hypothetical protein